MVRLTYVHSKINLFRMKKNSRLSIAQSQHTLLAISQSETINYYCSLPIVSN